MNKIQMLAACKNWLARHPRLATGSALLLLPALTLIGMEAVHRQSYALMLEWFSYHTLESLLGLLLVMLFGGLFSAVIGSVPVGFGVSGLVLLVLAFISQYKMSFLREPLLPWDLFLSKQGMDLLPYLYKGIGWINVLTVLGFVLIACLLWKILPKMRMRVPYRLLTAAVALFLFSALGWGQQPIVAKLTEMGVNNYVFEQDVNFRYNGFALGFAMNVGNVVIREPDGYSEEAVTKALADVAVPATAGQAAPSDQHPNVIFVMSEAFWDPTRLPNVTFSRDPMPNLRALMKEHTSGWLYSPQFGGGTANVEFEVLTGNSMSFLPTGSVAYQQYIHGQMPSLASLYAKQGYETAALHTYQKWFWNRDKVYPNLGFQRFIGLDDLQQPAYHGPFASDTEITKAISQLTDNADSPLFLYTVTMQNHGPYTEPRYDNTIRVEGNISAENKALLETYAQGISDSDAQLQALVDHLQQLKEPTMLVFFGDHLPVLGTTYQETGYFDDPNADAAEAYSRQYTTPLLVWTNYEQEREELAGLNASFLGAKVLHMTNAKSSAYFDFVHQFAVQAPVLRNEMVMTADGSVQEGVQGSLKELMRRYELLQYDMVFGKQYSVAPSGETDAS